MGRATAAGPEVVMTPSADCSALRASDTLVDLPARSVGLPFVEEAMKNLDLFVPSVADAIDSILKELKLT